MAPAAAAEALPALDAAVTLSLPTPREPGGLWGAMVGQGAAGHRSGKGKQRALVLLSLFSTALQSFSGASVTLNPFG